MLSVISVKPVRLVVVFLSTHSGTTAVKRVGSDDTDSRVEVGVDID